MVSLELVAILLSGVSISASLFYYANVLRNQNETKQSQLFMQLFQEMNNERFWENWIELVAVEIPDYDTFLEKYDSSVDKKHFAKRTQMWYTYSAIGELVKRGVLNIENIEPLIGNAVLSLWEKWGDIIKRIRIDTGMFRTFEGLEYLNQELTRYYDKHPELQTLDREVFLKAKF